MKIVAYIAMILIMSTFVFADVPEIISVEGVVRDAVTKEPLAATPTLSVTIVYPIEGGTDNIEADLIALNEYDPVTGFFHHEFYLLLQK